MKNDGQHFWGQHILTLLSVLAVFLGLSAHETTSSRAQAALSPAPLPELRAATPPPGGPGVVGEPVGAPRVSTSASGHTCLPVRSPHPGFAPEPLAQSGAKRLEGG